MITLFNCVSEILIANYFSKVTELLIWMIYIFSRRYKLFPKHEEAMPDFISGYIQPGQIMGHDKM